MDKIFIMLVGIPGSGKTFSAHKYAEEHKDTVIVSTDIIRKNLFGDESMQYSMEYAQRKMKHMHINTSGMTADELKRKAEIICRTAVYNTATYKICSSLRNGKSVIFDATNIYRRNRIYMLKKVNSICSKKICWYFDVLLKTALNQNKNRSRIVDEKIITKMKTMLQTPLKEEGFDEIITLK